MFSERTLNEYQGYDLGQRKMINRIIKPEHFDRLAWIGIGGAFGIRILVIVLFFITTDPHHGDANYYIFNARTPDELLGFPPYLVNGTTSIGPLYPLFLMPFYHLIPDSLPLMQIVGVRLAQVVLDTLVVGLVYLIVYHLFDRKAARVALIVQALDPRYMMLNGVLATERLFIVLICGFMLVYLVAVEEEQRGIYRLAGLLLGLTILTRPVAFAYPLLLVIHPWLQKKKHRMKQNLIWLLAVLLLVVMPWTVRVAILTGEFVPGSDALFSHFWRRTREDGDILSTDEALQIAIQEDTGYGETDINTEGTEYFSAGLANIFEAPGRWIKAVVVDTAGAYSQPYGTVVLSPEGISLKATLLNVLRGEATFDELVRGTGLFRRALMYLWHYWALILGVAGMAITWRRSHWHETYPLLAWAVYLGMVTAPLLSEPRYVFPGMFVFTIFAAYASVHLWEKKEERRKKKDER